MKSSINSHLNIYTLLREKGRNTHVTLTENGEHYVSQTIGKLIGIENKIYMSWSQEERDLFIQLNQRFADELGKSVNQWEECL